MRQQQAWVVQAQLTPEQQIQIKAARTPALFARSIAAECSLEGLQLIEEVQSSRSRYRARDLGNKHHGVDVGGLINRTTNRPRLDQLRRDDPAGVQPGKGGKQEFEPRNRC